MRNSEYFKGTYDEIHAPEALFGKVMDMNMKRKELKVRNMVKYAFCAMAMLIVTFVASNGICYATTGESLISKICVYVDGEPVDGSIEWHESDGTIYGEVDLPIAGLEDMEPIEIDNSKGRLDTKEFYVDMDMESVNENKSKVEFSIVTGDDVLFEENGRIILWLFDQDIDITEDFADGEAKGMVEFKGATFQYIVTGTFDDYEWDVIEQNE